MPSPDPAPLGPAGGSPPPDEVLELLYRSGEPRNLAAAARQWHRLDFSRRPRRIDSTTIACDGERRWRVFQDRILAGPAAPLRDDIAVLADSCWLLRGRLSGGAELTYRGRPARQLRVTSVHGGEEPVLGLMVFPADAIVDAGTGCLLRLISCYHDTPVIWSELDDISTSKPARTSSGCTSRPAPAPWRKPAT